MTQLERANALAKAKGYISIWHPPRALREKFMEEAANG